MTATHTEAFLNKLSKTELKEMLLQTEARITLKIK